MHYKDGTEAKLGDVVKGKPYTTGHEVVGEVVGLVPGADSCNVRVAFLKSTPARYSDKGDTLIVPLSGRPVNALGGNELFAGSSFNPLEPPVVLWPCVDYGATKDFELVARTK